MKADAEFPPATTFMLLRLAHAWLNIAFSIFFFFSGSSFGFCSAFTSGVASFFFSSPSARLQHDRRLLCSRYVELCFVPRLVLIPTENTEKRRKSASPAAPMTVAAITVFCAGAHIFFFCRLHPTRARLYPEKKKYVKSLRNLSHSPQPSLVASRLIRDFFSVGCCRFSNIARAFFCISLMLDTMELAHKMACPWCA